LRCIAIGSAGEQAEQSHHPRAGELTLKNVVANEWVFCMTTAHDGYTPVSAMVLALFRRLCVQTTRDNPDTQRHHRNHAECNYVLHLFAAEKS
jgi:hypothetical protein